MAVPQDKDARQFYRAASSRLDDGRALLRVGRYHGVVYLTGYAIECGLKALLIERTPAGERSRLLGSFRGTAAHDFEWLRRGLAGGGVVLPADVLSCLVDAGGWAVSMRYRAEPGDAATAREFVRRSGIILAWIERSI